MRTFPCVLLLVLSCCTSQKIVDYKAFTISEEALKEISSRVVFTTALDRREDPVNSVSSFDLAGGGEAITYILWFDLTAGQHYYVKLRWLDPDGKIYDQQDLIIKTTEPSHDTYFTFYLRDGVTPRGEFTVQIFLNNRLAREDKIAVR